MSGAALLFLVPQYHPYPQSDAYVIEAYVTNVLRMCACVVLRQRELLQFVVERMVEVDLMAPRDQLKAAALQEEGEEVEDQRSSDDELFPIEDVSTQEGIVT